MRWIVLLLALVPLAVSAGTITWTNDGGDGWDDSVGENWSAADINAVKTAVDDNDSRIGTLEDADAVRAEFYCDAYPGADVGARCNAAFAAMVVQGSGGILWLPRGVTIPQSTPIDLCDESGANQHGPVILKGHGGSLGSAGTRLVAGASLRPPAISPTSLSVVAGGGVGGRDRIECVGCDFTAELDRGDWIAPAGFTDAANNVDQASGEMPLVVYAIAPTYIDVEGYSTIDAGLVSTVSPDVDATIQALVAQVKACSHSFRVEDLSLDGDSTRRADFGILFAPDNNVAGACTAAGVPYAVCTAAGTSSGVNAVSIGTTIQRVTARAHAWASIAVTSTNDMGQADNFVLRDSRLQDSLIGVWMDTIQAHPALYVVNTDIHGFDRKGVLVTAGAAYLESNTIISESAACAAGSLGPCAHVQLEDANTLGLSMFGNDVEVKAGDGIIVQSVTTQGRHVVLRDNAINQNDDGATTSLVDVQGICGTVVNDGNKYRTVGTGVSVAPVVRFANSGQGSCPAILSGRSSYFLAAGASGLAPVLSVENGIPTALFVGDSLGAATATTPSVDDNDTSVATTAFVQAETVAAGDVTGTLGSGLTIGSNAVALSTDTTGNYVATIADSGASEVTVSGSGSEGAAVTLAIASSITRDSELRAFTVSASAASGACTAGDLWLKTTATVTLYACTATDTWSTGVGI